MERPYEYLRRLANSVPERDKDQLLGIADQLEKFGRVYTVKIDAKQQGLLNKILQENGIFLTDNDKLVVSEPWDRPNESQKKNV